MKFYKTTEGKYISIDCIESLVKNGESETIINIKNKREFEITFQNIEEVARRIEWIHSCDINSN